MTYFCVQITFVKKIPGQMTPFNTEFSIGHCIQVYGKAWFYALKHHSIVDGSKVFHRLVVSLQKFDCFREKKVDEVQKSGATHQKSGAARQKSRAVIQNESSSSEDTSDEDSDDNQETAEDNEGIAAALFKKSLKPQKSKKHQRERIKKAVNRNAYWAHPENTLVAMYHDDDIEVRQRAFEVVKVLQQRQKDRDEQQMAEKGRKTVRKFRPPAVDWSTEDYTGFLNFVDEKDWTCPPVFLDVAEDVLRAGVTEGRSKDVFDLVGYPNNTRCVERAVQSNTYASAITQTEQHREEVLALMEYSRRTMPEFRKKSDWVPHYN